jgi:apolipoprotein N-acyltransferase
MARNQAAFLINMTNDAWYGKTSAPYQHFSMAVFRAVENRRSLIRSANTGISGFIDPAGRIIASTQLFQEAVITRSMPVLKSESFYTRHGDVFALTCMAICILFFLRRRPKEVKQHIKEAHYVFGNQTKYQGTLSEIRTVQGVSLTWLARKDG